MTMTAIMGAGGVTITLNGGLVFSDGNDFRRHMAEVFAHGAGKISLDMSGLSYINGAGLGMLMMMRRECARHGVELVLRGPRGEVRKVLRLVKFDRNFCVVD